ncbi:MAG: RHS repeat-associated core domain-containing protein [Planctomycetota bacterium]
MPTAQPRPTALAPPGPSLVPRISCLWLLEADPLFTTNYDYNAADRLIREEGPPVGSPSHRIAQSFAYDEIGNKTAVTNGKGYTTVYVYDENSNLIRVEEPEGRVTQYGYDELNRRTSVIDGNGHETISWYDNADRLERSSDAEGNEWTYEYDAHGNMTRETSPCGITLTHEYDALNRRTKSEDELGYTSTSAFDKRGGLTSQTDPNGNTTQYGYDGLGRLVSVLEPDDPADPNDGGLTQYQYDEAGNLTQIKDANDHIVSTRAYDEMNRLLVSTDALSNSFQYAYDPVGNQISVTDAKGETTTITYDAENRLVRFDYPDTTHVTYTFDDNNNLSEMSDWVGSSTFTHDDLDRFLSSTDAYGKTVQYGYDLVGNRTSLTYPDGKQVTYAYDMADRLTTITNWAAGGETRYTYCGTRLETVTYPNGVVESRGYDDAGRLTSIDTLDSLGSLLLHLAWARDGVGNPTSLTETGTLEPTLEYASGFNVDYRYDGDNRLLDSRQVGRPGATGAAQSTAAGPPPPSGRSTYEHDPNGNLTRRIVLGVTTEFSYDDDEHLVSQATGGRTIQHVYDGVGNRIARVENGVAKRYVVDRSRSMSHVLCETDEAGTISAYYVHGPQIVAGIGADGSEHYYHANDIGNVLALTDRNGQITDRYGYTPFGLLWGREGATGNPFTYVGALGVMEEADGLYFMRARFYDPETGRFLGKDPVEGALTAPQGLHRYVYGENDPVRMLDPTGKFLREIIDIIEVLLDLYDTSSTGSDITAPFEAGMGEIADSSNQLVSDIEHGTSGNWTGDLNQNMWKTSPTLAKILGIPDPGCSECPDCNSRQVNSCRKRDREPRRPPPPPPPPPFPIVKHKLYYTFRNDNTPWLPETDVGLQSGLAK